MIIKDIEFLLKKFLLPEKYLLEKRLKGAVNNNYEKELSIISNFSDRKRDAVDVGVYRGVYSYKLSKEFKHVYAFEPNPLIYPFLKKNLTKIIKNITLENFALSDSAGEVELKIPNRTKSVFKNNYEEIYRLGCATIHKSNKMDNYNSFKVKKKKLDDLLADKDISFIKIEVEGHEREVLSGSKKIISKNMPNLLVEIEGRHSKQPVLDTIKYINDFGYQSFVTINNELEKTENIKDLNSENNFIFLPKN